MENRGTDQVWGESLLAAYSRLRIDPPHLRDQRRGSAGRVEQVHREPVLLIDLCGLVGAFGPVWYLLRSLGLPALLAQLEIGPDTVSGLAVWAGLMGGLMLLLAGPIVVVRHWVYRGAGRAVWGDWTWLLAGLAGWAATIMTTTTRTETEHNRLLVFVVASLVATSNLTLVGVLADSLGWVERRPQQFWTERLGATITWTAAVLWMLVVAAGALTA